MDATRARAVAAYPRITVLDVDPVWREFVASGFVVEVVAPADVDAAVRGALDSARTLLNLAAPGALAALEALQAADFARHVWAYLGAPGARCGLLLGPAGTVRRPFDADALAATLSRWLPRDARVVLAGGDGRALLALRHALVRQGPSVSLAWNATQATEVLSLVRPDLAVVDLDLPPAGGHRIVAQLARIDPPPAMLLLPGRGDDAAGLLAALVSPGNARWLRLREDILAAVLPTQPSLLQPPLRLGGAPAPAAAA
ncbi:MAG TPA: hypothetical protein VKW76_11200 [Candidatus Binatia bacterium]|nr:hypothetical protein [Candidatus Binatia bacterium]